MRNIIKSSNVSDVFQVWDPRPGGTPGLEGFQTFIKDNTRDENAGSYEVTPGGGSYDAGRSVNNFIQSGQAFIVQTSGGSGTVSFNESVKASGNALFSRPAYASTRQRILRGKSNDRRHQTGYYYLSESYY